MEENINRSISAIITNSPLLVRMTAGMVECIKDKEYGQVLYILGLSKGVAIASLPCMWTKELDDIHNQLVLALCKKQERG